MTPQKDAVYRDLERIKTRGTCVMHERKRKQKAKKRTAQYYEQALKALKEKKEVSIPFNNEFGHPDPVAYEAIQNISRGK